MRLSFRRVAVCRYNFLSYLLACNPFILPLAAACNGASALRIERFFRDSPGKHIQSGTAAGQSGKHDLSDREIWIRDSSSYAHIRFRLWPERLIIVHGYR